VRCQVDLQKPRQLAGRGDTRDQQTRSHQGQQSSHQDHPQRQATPTAAPTMTTYRSRCRDCGNSSTLRHVSSHILGSRNPRCSTHGEWPSSLDSLISQGLHRNWGIAVSCTDFAMLIRAMPATARSSTAMTSWSAVIRAVICWASSSPASRTLRCRTVTLASACPGWRTRFLAGQRPLGAGQSAGPAEQVPGVYPHVQCCRLRVHRRDRAP